MLVLGIYGSPRKKGNTDLMLDAFLEGAAEAGADIERVYARRLQVSGCLECGGCDETGECVVEDDMGQVYPLLESAERIVVASPIFFYCLTAQLKAIIDRSQAPYMKRELSKKEGGGGLEKERKGFFLSAGATKGKRLFECPILVVKYFFDALGIPYEGELCFREIEAKGDISDHSTALGECRAAGRTFAAGG